MNNSNHVFQSLNPVSMKKVLYLVSMTLFLAFSLPIQAQEYKSFEIENIAH